MRVINKKCKRSYMVASCFNTPEMCKSSWRMEDVSKVCDVMDRDGKIICVQINEGYEIIGEKNFQKFTWFRGYTQVKNYKPF